jgi:hypothetical protein
LFVYLFVCLFVGLFICLLDCLFVGLLDCLFVCLLDCLFVCLLDCVEAGFANLFCQTRFLTSRKVKNWDQDLWDSKCLEIVTIANYHKFTQDPGRISTLVA